MSMAWLRDEEDKPELSASLPPFKGAFGQFLPQPRPAPRLGAPATSSSPQVRLTETGFQPEQIDIYAGQSLVFVVSEAGRSYFDSRPRQHVIGGDHFESELLHPGDKFRHTFSKPGSYEVRCLIRSKLRCTVDVRQPPAEELKPSDLRGPVIGNLKRAAEGRRAWNPQKQLKQVQRKLQQQARLKAEREEQLRSVERAPPPHLGDYMLNTHKEFTQRYTSMRVSVTSDSEEEEEQKAKSDEQEEADFIAQQRASSRASTRFKSPSSHVHRSASDGPTSAAPLPQEEAKSQSAKEMHKSFSRVGDETAAIGTEASARESGDRVQRKLSFSAATEEVVAIQSSREVRQCADMGVVVSHSVLAEPPVQKRGYLKYTVRYQGWSEPGRDQVVYKRGEDERVQYLEEEAARSRKARRTEEQRKQINKRKKEKRKTARRVALLIASIEQMVEDASSQEEGEEEGGDCHAWIWERLALRRAENEQL